MNTPAQSTPSAGLFSASLSLAMQKYQVPALMSGPGIGVGPELQLNSNQQLIRNCAKFYQGNQPSVDQAGRTLSAYSASSSGTAQIAALRSNNWSGGSVNASLYGAVINDPQLQSSLKQVPSILPAATLMVGLAESVVVSFIGETGFVGLCADGGGSVYGAASAQFMAGAAVEVNFEIMLGFFRTSLKQIGQVNLFTLDAAEGAAISLMYFSVPGQLDEMVGFALGIGVGVGGGIAVATDVSIHTFG